MACKHLKNIYIKWMLYGYVKIRNLKSYLFLYTVPPQDVGGHCSPLRSNILLYLVILLSPINSSIICPGLRTETGWCTGSGLTKGTQARKPGPRTKIPNRSNRWLSWHNYDYWSPLRAVVPGTGQLTLFPYLNFVSVSGQSHNWVAITPKTKTKLRDNKKKVLPLTQVC